MQSRGDIVDELVNRQIIHVDMDAFFAAVETRDDPTLKGKPLVIGSLPGERGVVSTCNYKAREYGIRSAMPINEAYRRCPHAHFMYPNMAKYVEVSNKIHEIWETYTDTLEYLSLDEGFLDVTGSTRLFGSAQNIAAEIKRRTWEEVGLTCSVGLGYSMSSAKTASEENKPNGYFEILTPEAMRSLLYPRSVREIYTVGPKTAERLERLGIKKVADIVTHQQRIIDVLGKHGHSIVELAKGIDYRLVGTRTKGQSIGSEQTFQTDITDLEYLKNVLRLIARKLSLEIKAKNLYAKTVTLKITYPGMKSITRASSAKPTDDSLEIYGRSANVLDQLPPQPIRLIGITLSNLTDTKTEVEPDKKQMSLFELAQETAEEQSKTSREAEKLNSVLYDLQLKHGKNIIKSASELRAEQVVKQRKKD